MKYILIGLLMMVSFSSYGINLDTSGLSESQIAQIRLDAAKLKEKTSTTTIVDGDDIITTLSAFQGIGKETGDAIKYALMGVVDVAEKFGGSWIGQITVALVIWRVVGVDIVIMLSMIIFTSIGVYVFNKLWKNAPKNIEYSDRKFMFGLLSHRVVDKIEYIDNKEQDAQKSVSLVVLIFVVVVNLLLLVNLG